MSEKTRVMIVEDEHIVAMSTKLILESGGYSVCSVTPRGEDAVELAGKQLPDIILMDIRLEGEMDGIEASRLIRESHDIPIIYTTAYADEQTINQAKQTVPYGYIIKPFNKREILKTIEIGLYNHRLECTLKKNFARLQSVMNTMSEGLVLLGIDRKIQLVNPATLNMTGFEEGFFRNRPVDQAFTLVDLQTNEVDKGFFFTNLSNLPQNDRFFLMKTAQGTFIQVICQFLQIRGETHGVSGGFLFVFRDITQQEETRHQLFLSNQQFSSLVQSMNDLVFSLDPEGHFTRFFGKWQEKGFGDVSQWEGKSAEPFFSAFGIPSVNPLPTALYNISQGGSENFDWPLQAGGIQKTFHVSLSPFFNQQGQNLGCVGVARDITDREKFQKDLGKTARLYSAVFQKYPVPMLLLENLFDKNSSLSGFVIQDINHSFSEKLGVEPCSAIGSLLAEICPDLLRELLVVLEQNPGKTTFGKKGMYLHNSEWDLEFQKISTNFSILSLHQGFEEQK
ncbi:MAG TPA: response regulator [Thermotogota bacterium]|nr:response regulator [Thermotogota bacterium]HRW93606.1 response regulator [Thermotogota bacterium]